MSDIDNPIDRRAIGTWVTREQYELFNDIAKQHGVSMSAYLRAVVVDVLAEEGPKVHTLFTKPKASVPRVRLTELKVVGG